MRLLGIGLRDVVALARHQRRVHDLRGPLLVTGMLAEQLANEATESREKIDRLVGLAGTYEHCRTVQRVE